MEDKDKIRFGKIMFGTAENFGSTITKEGLAIRFEALREFSIEEIEQAAIQIVKSRRFAKMPPTGEFFAILKGTKEEKALEAWGEVMECLEMDKQPKDPITNKVIKRLGGWCWLEQQTYDELRWIEKRFIEHYSSYSNKRIREEIKMLDKGNKVKRLPNAGGIGYGK